MALRIEGRVTEWEVIESFWPNTVPDVNPVEVEYSIYEEEFLFVVVQVMVADLTVVVEEMAEIAGTVVSDPKVVKVEAVEVAQFEEPSQDLALKLCVVPGVRPTNRTMLLVAYVVTPCERLNELSMEYSTVAFAISSRVFHLMVAPEFVIEEVATLVIVGGAVSEGFPPAMIVRTTEKEELFPISSSVRTL